MQCPSWTALVAVLILALKRSADAATPNVVLVVVDDLGWTNVGWHSPTDPNVITPHMDALVRDGIELDRMYAYKYCSPTRSSILSGRLPVHVTQYCNYESVYSAGAPPGMTFISERLKGAGYQTHAIGKWDVGSARQEQTPSGRGFDTSLIYFEAAQDHYTQCCGGLAVARKLFPKNSTNRCQPKYHDLWQNNGPAADLVGNYSGWLFTAEALRVLDSHDTSNGPLFLYLAYQNCHAPLEVPAEFEQHHVAVKNENRRKYAAMVEFVDSSLGNVTAALKARDLWTNTFLLLTSDNGGPLGSANNYPLRGGKVSDWEGGVRVSAFISGGLVPPALRGSRKHGYMHVADIYATICHLAGITDPTDNRAAAAGLPPIDSLDMVDFLFNTSTTATSPRQSMLLATPSLKWGNVITAPNGVRANQWSYQYNSAGAYIAGAFKLYVGINQISVWSGPFAPNNTVPPPNGNGWPEVQVDCSEACLFNIIEDPYEYTNLASAPEYKSILKQMKAAYNKEATSVYDPDRGDPTEQACDAYNDHGGFVGPYL